MSSSITKAVIFLACCSLAFGAVAQTANTVRASVEKAVWGVQTGFLGIWAHNELRLADPIALRIELGLSGQLYDGRGVEDVAVDLMWAPVIRVEPRWYYNLGKRKHYSKNITGNNGNFVSLPVTYIFGWPAPALDDKGNLRQIDVISIVPTWGLRRNVTRHLTVELGGGLGLLFPTQKVVVISVLRKLRASVLFRYNLHLRIGYRF